MYSQDLRRGCTTAPASSPTGRKQWVSVWQLRVHSQAGFSSRRYTSGMLFKSPTRLNLLLASLLFGLLLSGCASLPPSNADNVCAVYKQKRGWHKVAKKAEQKWGTSMHIAMAIMQQESGFAKKARPPRRYYLGFIPGKRPSSAYGYAQVIDGTWQAYVNDTGDYWRERTDFADATDFVHWYMREAINRNGVAPSDAYSLYLNYHEGTAGFKRGTYKNKSWLRAVALKVQRRSENYRAQYASCKNDFKPGFFSRLLGA